MKLTVQNKEKGDYSKRECEINGLHKKEKREEMRDETNGRGKFT